VDCLEERAEEERRVFGLDFVFGGPHDGKVFLPLEGCIKGPIHPKGPHTSKLDRAG
jgi:hypothetical protein